MILGGHSQSDSGTFLSIFLSNLKLSSEMFFMSVGYKVAGAIMTEFLGKVRVEPAGHKVWTPPKIQQQKYKRKYENNYKSTKSTKELQTTTKLHKRK